MDSSGALVASLVIIGDVVDVLGTADSAVSPSTGMFSFTPYTGEELVGPFDVRVDATDHLILADCGTRSAPSHPAACRRVFGQLAAEAPRGPPRVAVILRTQEFKG
jgi:hypothetical protein